MQQILEKGQQVLINVISKSGTTTESIVNFNLFLGYLKQYRPETYQQFVVVTSDDGSLLSDIAHKEQFSLLTIPPIIGGRYSVFTAVGLFPLGMLGVDIQELCHGGQQVVTDVLSNKNNDAVYGAYVSYNQCLEQKNIHDMFVFGSELTSLGLWYRQLVGESLGKDKKIGITPTVSVGTTDLHSVGQLYLGGPRDKYVTFVTTNQQCDLFFDSQPELQALMPMLKKNDVEYVMQAIIQGTKKAYTIDDRSFESWYIPKNAYSCGQFLQCSMMRIVYMAHLFQVNPFDQPHVELYKRHVREILRYE
jgi:glucose-6-phosphate isomerase